MRITQDDLAFLTHLRAAASGGERAEGSRCALAVEPGRAAGRVAAWSFDRAASLLARASRRPLILASAGEIVPTADERAVLRLARAVARGEDGREAARWLVRGEAALALCEAIAPAAETAYARPACRARAAARA